MSLTRSLVVTVIAGAIGTIANAIVVNALTGADVAALVLSPGRHAVAIATALLLIPVFRGLHGTGAALTAIVALTVIPSILARTVFGVEAPWSFVLGVNAVYAVTATVIYAVGWRSKR